MHICFLKSQSYNCAFLDYTTELTESISVHYFDKSRGVSLKHQSLQDLLCEVTSLPSLSVLREQSYHHSILQKATTGRVSLHTNNVSNCSEELFIHFSSFFLHCNQIINCPTNSGRGKWYIEHHWNGSSSFCDEGEYHLYERISDI